MTRPILTKQLNPDTFTDYYYLKDELVSFCRIEKLPTTGNKKELTERIYLYLKTGDVKKSLPKNKGEIPINITLDSIIERNIVCSEVHRVFFKKHLGETFTFKVVFQKWLKNNPGKKYSDAIKIYPEIVAIKTDKIDSQFEYNTYIRDFFNDNSELNLKEAIACWKYKKSTKGHNKYDKNDLNIL